MELIGDYEYIRITSHLYDINTQALCYSWNLHVEALTPRTPKCGYFWS